MNIVSIGLEQNSFRNQVSYKFDISISVIYTINSCYLFPFTNAISLAIKITDAANNLRILS